MILVEPCYFFIAQHICQDGFFVNRADADIEKWCPELVITKTLGMRTFWDMQQNQEIHKDTDWQDKMVEIEMRVSDMDGYKEIAFFHHLIIEKRWC